ncbi:glycosyltransferase family 39 protein [Pedobacter hartonius]|uniref:4-amino-4-deoxy-L-arabinose transferase n=1 Tax=Pedobacter hartonius TaxID=425514 RepID=A0A1H4GJD0_9SPHI|nr:glycosyltransferase family 39 protein [Pedobacter hartonius]SEB09100.1 4-amino-4-deoxy-L-arabinose transferase [Pedobacter hartonius]
MTNLKETYSEKDQYHNRLIFCIVLLGLLFRLFHYFYDRSLWMDEIYLSSSFSHMSYKDIAAKILDYGQKAPLGFLWLVKLSVSIFGYNSMSLRLVPLIAGILSLFYFGSVCRYFLKPRARVVALIIFAFAPALIYHSVEIKQYSTECLATVIALYLFSRYQANQTWRAMVCWGFLGAILIWFSFSVIFILAGMAVGISLSFAIKKDWKAFFMTSVPFCMWLLSFIVNYLVFTHKHAESEWVVYFFKVYDNFMPFPPHSIQQIKWFSRNFYDMMDYPLGMVWNFKDFTNSTIVKIITVPIVAIVLLFTGIYSLFRINKRDFCVLLFPVALMLIASGLYLYPLLERFWVFIAPIFIIFIANGFDYYQIKLKSKTIVWILFILVTVIPVIQSIYFVIRPHKFYKHKKSYEKEALIYINDNFREDDAVYNYWNNAPGYRVYRHMLHFKYNAIQGHDFRKNSGSLQDYNQNLKIDFKKFSGKQRVWLIYNTQFLTDIGDLIDDPRWYYKEQVTPAGNLISQFNQLGKPIKKMQLKDVTVYLYELGTTR